MRVIQIFETSHNTSTDGFISENPEFIKRKNNYNMNENKLVFKCEETNFLRRYGHISHIDYRSFELIKHAELSSSLKTGLKIVTACLYILYFGSCDNPYDRNMYDTVALNKKNERNRR